MASTLSILILTYNRIDLSKIYIPLILNNIGNVDCEVLIWDNASTDGTFDWLYEYQKADCRLTKVFGSDENIGMEAINSLAEEADSKYILKVDDDIIVPERFAERLVVAYEAVNEEKLLFLGWDMPWRNKTFATRSGMSLYKNPLGKEVQVGNETVYICYDPSKWMINGPCRLSKREDFLKIGGHPKGVKYGVDSVVSKRAAKHGYWIGFFSSSDLVHHMGIHDAPNYRQFKNRELSKTNSPLHV